LNIIKPLGRPASSILSNSPNFSETLSVSIIRKWWDRWPQWFVCILMRAPCRAADAQWGNLSHHFLMVETERPLKRWTDYCSELTRLVAEEDAIEFSRRESFKSYIRKYC
jgi:hypothetical protein